MNKELKPCPFCGGKGELLKVYERLDNASLDARIVKCLRCKARTEKISTYNFEKKDLDNEAILLWNIRSFDDLKENLMIKKYKLENELKLLFSDKPLGGMSNAELINDIKYQIYLIKEKIEKLHE